MRILITGSLVFLLWAIFASWIYVYLIKPSFVHTAENAIGVNATVSEPKSPDQAMTLKPEPLVLYFNNNSALVNSSPELENLSLAFREWLLSHPESNLTIVGHTDSKGSDKFNQYLGFLRADRTKKYFTQKGVLPDKIICTSAGESLPVTDNSNEENRAKNRRAEITIN